MSLFERRRAANIERNKRKLEELNLTHGAATLIPKKVKAKAPKRRSKTKVVKSVTVPTRRSSRRTRGAKPDYTGERVDTGRVTLTGSSDGKASGEREEDILTKEERAELRRQQLQRKAQQNTERVLEESRAHRQKLLQALDSGDRVADASIWRDQAVARWGPRVPASVPDWKAYVLSRTSTPPQTKDDVKMGFLQEQYSGCVWRLLVACVLMSRVSSVQVKTTCIRNFFELCPTPSRAVDADPSDVFQNISPLGLFPNRMKSVVAISEKFLTMPVFEVGLTKELKIFGIGEFGYHSYLIFTRGQGLTLAPSDKNLKRYVQWLRKHSVDSTNTKSKSI